MRAVSSRAKSSEARKAVWRISWIRRATEWIWLALRKNSWLEMSKLRGQLEYEHHEDGREAVDVIAVDRVGEAGLLAG